ncbi:MAG: hypothetical protein AAF193_08200 [Bacteroidota bacterium]
MNEERQDQAPSKSKPLVRYRYLGRGYLATGNKEKAIMNYQTMLDFAVRKDEVWRLDDAVEDLEDFANKKNGHQIAQEILNF